MEQTPNIDAEKGASSNKMPDMDSLKASITKLKSNVLQKLKDRNTTEKKTEIEDPDDQKLDFSKLKMNEGLRVFKKGLKSDDDEAMLDGLKQILGELNGG